MIRKFETTRANADLAEADKGCIVRIGGKPFYVSGNVSTGEASGAKGQVDLGTVHEDNDISQVPLASEKCHAMIEALIAAEKANGG